MRKLIVNIFNIVAQFSLLLTSRPWEEKEGSVLEHPDFEMIEESYKKFQEYSVFLYTGELG